MARSVSGRGRGKSADEEGLTAMPMPTDIPVALAYLDEAARRLLLQQPTTRANQALSLLAAARRRLATARDPVDIVIAQGQIERAMAAWIVAQGPAVPPMPRASL